MPNHHSSQDGPVNLLSLDGGGVRGVSSLVILDGIMNQIKDLYQLPETPKPCEFFHMIAGTSTGGLIAIMLGRLRMSTKEALEAYDDCASKIFSKQNRKRSSLSDKFKSVALQKAIEEIVEKRGLGENMRDSDGPDKGLGDDWDENVKIWEAARATTAASSFFKPQKLGQGDLAQAYIDAAIGSNNPVNYLLPEARGEFGTARRLGCLVSIGTGTRNNALDALRVGGVQSFLTLRGVRNVVDIFKTLKNTATDAEESHRQLLARLKPFPDSYYRFNVPSAAARVKLHHYQKIPELKSLTAQYLADPDISSKVVQVARALKTGIFHHGLTLGLVHDLDPEQVLLQSHNPGSQHLVTSFFTGREDVLQRLDTFFAPRNTGGKPRREFLLHGMGGVGKSEVAHKFSEMFEERFKYIFHIDGSMPATVAQSYATIAKQYNLASQGSVEALMNLAKRWIEEQTAEWLMIFDDCKLDERQGHLPGRGKGSIIYTSRSTVLGGDLPPDCSLEIECFSEEHAIELLLKASGREPGPGAEDLDSARAIVQEVGSLPMAISNAAATIRERRSSFGRFLEKLKEEKVRIRSDPRFKGKNIENTAVYAVLEVSYEALMTQRRRTGRGGSGAAARVAAKVLTILSFFHHQNIPIETLTRVAKERATQKTNLIVPLRDLVRPPDRDLDRLFMLKEDGEWNPHYFGVGINVLEAFSLIKTNAQNGTISMHVLIHDWAQDRLDAEMYRQYDNLTRTILTESILISQNWTDSFFVLALKPHLDPALKRGPPWSSHENHQGWLYLRVGWYHFLAKDFKAAEKAFLDALSICKVQTRLDVGDLFQTLHNLGLLYHEVGRLAEAELVFCELIDRVQGRIKDYEALLIERRGEADERAEQERTTQEWSKKQRLGRTYRESLDAPAKGLGKVAAEALPGIILRRSLPRILPRRHNGTNISRPRGPRPGDPDIKKLEEDFQHLQLRRIELHAELARVCVSQDRIGQAKSLFTQSLQFFKEDGYLSHESPWIMRLEHDMKSFTNPADLPYWQGRLDLASDLADTGFRDFPQHGGYWELVAAYANCLMKNDMWDIALEYYEKMRVHFVMARGPNDWKVLGFMRQLVDCYVHGEGRGPAVEIARDCVDRAEKTYGENHHETVLSMEKLCDALRFETLDADDEVTGILQCALVRSEIALGANHQTTKRIKESFSLAKSTSKQPEELPIQPNGESNGEPKKGINWQDCIDLLNDLTATLGEQHVLTKRQTRLVGDGPPSTFEEYVERVTASYGPQSQTAKELASFLETWQEQAAELRRLKQQAKLQDGDGLPEHCTCGELVHAEESKAYGVPIPIYFEGRGIVTTGACQTAQV
ncbi:hypothetical protein B0J18DRAFT_482331 [Chaetomium sp. MPI-SDFR-AT-0129]|nr:hypothetical protein B0J18DRAFT_482331 [Chaetomium sp. MPI-SDFR-AT-0129]